MHANMLNIKKTNNYNYLHTAMLYYIVIMLKYYSVNKGGNLGILL